MMKIDIVSQECVYDGFFSLNRFVVRHECFDGSQSAPLVRERIDRARAAAVLLHDAQRDSVVLVEQFRIGAVDDPHSAWLIECPAGMIEAGEQPMEVAQRECCEEVGRLPVDLQQIGEYYVSPGGSSEKITLYYGQIDSTGLNNTLCGVAHEGEDIRVLVVPWREIETQLDEGSITNATTLIALQWVQIARLKGTLPVGR
ncbi:NUDIX domain-containing protein [Desulfuromonas acetoxidans]|nr:NUDIX domain-containing protein [Desulfuromonas acetoxidans]MBF0646095.1 NUDIX domain-containing protein [Desulfuromonas acetoxidans]NVD25171.1 NUDIX domain-containing protein [Desulfuromonas acetoxidans]NVE17207.1 NUDIX domain-containing protein [Desulfuromonas acetoxidans]